jgi:hypothetical protein
VRTGVDNSEQWIHNNCCKRRHCHLRDFSVERSWKALQPLVLLRDRCFLWLWTLDERPLTRTTCSTPYESFKAEASTARCHTESDVSDGCWSSF